MALVWLCLVMVWIGQGCFSYALWRFAQRVYSLQHSLDNATINAEKFVQARIVPLECDNAKWHRLLGGRLPPR